MKNKLLMLVAIFGLLLQSPSFAGDQMFHVVKTTEASSTQVIASEPMTDNLSGIANPAQGVGRYGGVWGSMHRPVLSMDVNDCAVTSGEVKLPQGYNKPTFNAEFLQFDMSIVNNGADWTLPDPAKNPEQFTTWACNNPQGRKQLKDFVLITFTDLSGKLVKEAKYPGLFFGDTFSANGVYKVSNRYPFAGQRIQMNDVPDGIYRIQIKVNPVYGASEPVSVLVKFTGQDIEIQKEEAQTKPFPTGLVWKSYAEEIPAKK